MLPNSLNVTSALSEWLSYLETCHPTSIDLGLDRISRVAARLDLLAFNCPVVTVAGTNGKGSCVALTEAILSTAGYRVATYTSPHLHHYNERIRVAGQLISDVTLRHAFNRIEKVRGDTSLTYFEFGTLAALWHFKQEQPDIIILEVGLGGRLDAVNCVDSDIAIISTIDLDHMEWLGGTHELIAKEKAGIMRPNKPCIFGGFSAPNSVIQQATALNSPLYLQGQAFDYKNHAKHWSWQSRQQCLEQLPLPSLELQNAATVLQTLELLGDRFLITRSSIENGLSSVFLSGRFQIMENSNTRCIVDVAHNPAGGRCLAKRLANEACRGATHAVVGMLADKDILNTLAALEGKIDYWYLADLNVPRGASAKQLSQCLMNLAASQFMFEFPCPIQAYKKACQSAKEGDQVLVFGSFHTAATILAI